MSGNWQRLRRFSRIYVKPRWRMFSFVQFLHVLAVGLLLVPPLLIRYVIDGAIPAGDMAGIFRAAGGMLAVAAFLAVAAAAKEYYGHEVAQGITSRLRNDLYSHFQKLSMSFHDRKKTGGLLSRIVDDMNVIQEVVHHGPEAIAMAGVTVTGIAALMFWMDWRLALVAIAFVPLQVIFTSRTAGKMWEQFREVRKRTEMLSDELEENLAGIQVIKGFGAEDREIESIVRRNDEHYRSRMSVIRYMARLFPGAVFINFFGVGAVLLYGGYLSISGLISLGTLAAFVMYLNRFLHPILRVVMMSEQAGRFFASIERFFDYMDVEPDIRDRRDAAPLETCRGEVTFEGVHFAYEDRPILQGVSFTAKQGEMIALVGPSGAGKTTIIRLIPRFYEPQQGRVLVDGQDIRHLRVRSLRSHIAAVMQDEFLFSGSVAENISYGRPDATREQVAEAADLANAMEFIREMPDGLDTTIGKRGVKLSEGQRQRLSIARALLRNPQILLLDEATSSVDPETELLIQRALNRLLEGRTTFAIAHRLSTIFEADRILFVQGGRIVESGTHRELLAAEGEYARFFSIQFREAHRV